MMVHENEPMRIKMNSFKAFTIKGVPYVVKWYFILVTCLSQKIFVLFRVILNFELPNFGKEKVTFKIYLPKLIYN